MISRFRLLVGLGLLSLACNGPQAARPGDDKVVALPDRNGVNLVEKGVPDDWSVAKNKEKNIKWKAVLGGNTYGPLVVAGDKIFVGANNGHPRDPKVKGDLGILMCFRAEDGKFLWQAVHAKLPNKEQNDFPEIGVTSMPVVEGDRLYYVSNRCELICADVEGDQAAGKAKFLWTLDMVKDLGVFPCMASNCSPVIIGDLIFTCTSNGRDADEDTLPAPDAPSFIAVDKKTGKVAWKSSAPGKNILKGQWASPTGAKVNGKWQVIFPGGDGWLYGFEAETGKLLWKFDGNPKASTYKAGGRGDRNYFVASPVMVENRLYIAAGQDPQDGTGVGHLWCVDIGKEPTNKDRDLSPVDDDFDAKSAKNKNSGLVWHFGGPVKPKPPLGEKEVVFGRSISNVAVADGLLYAADVNGYLYCLDAKTGAKYWEHDFKATIWASPYVVDGKVFVGTESSDMCIFEHGKTYKEPKVVEMRQSVLTPPVASKGVLFVHNQDTLYAIKK
jgi:outer membrane protein assembly factor BamB